MDEVSEIRHFHFLPGIGGPAKVSFAGRTFRGSPLPGSAVGGAVQILLSGLRWMTGLRRAIWNLLCLDSAMTRRWRCRPNSSLRTLLDDRIAGSNLEPALPRLGQVRSSRRSPLSSHWPRLYYFRLMGKPLRYILFRA